MRPATKTPWRGIATTAVTLFMIGVPLLGMATGTMPVPEDVYIVTVIVGYILLLLSLIGKRPMYSDIGHHPKRLWDGDSDRSTHHPHALGEDGFIEPVIDDYPDEGCSTFSLYNGLDHVANRYEES